MTGWELAVRHMAENDGLARRTSLLELGVTTRMVQRRLAGGLLTPVNPWVVALPGTELNLVTLTRAAVLARPHVIPTGLSSAALLGDGPWSELPLVGDPWLVGADDRVTQARFLRHPGLQTVRRAGMVIAHPSATVIDLLRFLDEEAAARVGRAALQRRVVSIPLLLQARARLGRHHGVRQLHLVTALLIEGTHSESEHRFVELLRDAGLTGWRANHPVRAGGRQYFIDVAFPQARLAIEIDGMAHHSDAHSFQRDRRRQNDLVAAGWTVQRFTWSDIVDSPQAVIARIVSALERAAVS